MCGSLRHSWESTKPPARPGEPLPNDAEVWSSSSNKLNHPITWQGFARGESLTKWLSGGWKEGTLSAVSFNEQGRDFAVPPGQRIKIIYLERPGKTVMAIVTRPPSTKEEKDTHPRFPQLVSK